MTESFCFFGKGPLIWATEVNNLYKELGSIPSYVEKLEKPTRKEYGSVTQQNEEILMSKEGKVRLKKISCSFQQSVLDI